MTIRRFALMILLMLAQPALITQVLASEDGGNGWDGLWFECEYSGKNAPPRDDCAMLDDDGFMFDGNDVTYMKVINSPETDACKKQRKGQCFKASQPAITVTPGRSGSAEFTANSIGLTYLLCTQIFHTSLLSGYIEARPDADRCFWAGEKYFYLRRYDGTITIED